MQSSSFSSSSSPSSSRTENKDPLYSLSQSTPIIHHFLADPPYDTQSPQIADEFFAYPPTLICQSVGAHNKSSFLSSFLHRQQYTFIFCHVYFFVMVCDMGCKSAYNSFFFLFCLIFILFYFLCCSQNFFQTARCIFV